MKIKSLLLILAFLYCATLLVNEVFSQRKYTESEILGKVLFFMKNDNGRGTGIIVKYKTKYILVSTTTVFAQVQYDSKLYFRTRTGGVDSIGFLDLMPVRDPHKDMLNSDADIECFILTPSSRKDSITLEQLSFQSEDMNPDLVDIPRQYTVNIYGYPLFSFENFAAISVTSNLSSNLIKLNILYKNNHY